MALVIYRGNFIEINNFLVFSNFCNSDEKIELFAGVFFNLKKLYW